MNLAEIAGLFQGIGDVAQKQKARGEENEMRNYFAQMISGEQDPVKKQLFQIASKNPKIAQEIFGQQAKSAFPQQYDMNQLLQMMQMFGINLPKQSVAPANTTAKSKIPKMYLDDLGDPLQYTPDTVIESYGKRFKPGAGGWEVVQ